MARTSRWQFENVDKNTFGGIARIVRKHSMVDVLLGAFSAVARGNGATRGARIQTSFNAMSLGVIGDILDNNAPFSVCVQCSFGSDVENFARADVSFTTDPVAL